MAGEAVAAVGAMNPYVAIGGAALQGLGSFFGAKSEADAQKDIEKMRIAEARRKNADARKYLGGYGYNAYQQKYLPALNPMLSDYLSGKLTAGQQNMIDMSRLSGTESLNNASASSNIVGGGRMALLSQLNRDLGNQALQMGTQNQQYGAGLAQNLEQFNLGDWIRQQESGMRSKELMAQYA